MVFTILRPSFNFCLNRFPCVHINNRFMISFNMILWKNSVIHDTPFGKKICCVTFLKNGITHILLISKHRIKRTGLPIVFSIPIFYPLSLKYSSNIISTVFPDKYSSYSLITIFACGLFTIRFSSSSES